MTNPVVDLRMQMARGRSRGGAARAVVRARSTPAPGQWPRVAGYLECRSARARSGLARASSAWSRRQGIKEELSYLFGLSWPEIGVSEGPPSVGWHQSLDVCSPPNLFVDLVPGSKWDNLKSEEECLVPVGEAGWIAAGIAIFGAAFSVALLAARSGKLRRQEISWSVATAISALMFSEIGLAVVDLKGHATTFDYLALASAAAVTIALMTRIVTRRG